LQGLLLAGVLGGGQSVDTFKPGGGITAAKAYMTFVLAFVGLTSIIVSPALPCNFGAFVLSGNSQRSASSDVRAT
jgi:chitin synthase